jgi:hypothetical protein
LNDGIQRVFRPGSRFPDNLICYKMKKTALFAIWSLFGGCLTVPAAEPPRIFPIPQEMEVRDGSFTLSENTRILVPQHASENDLKLAYFLVRELSKKHGTAVKVAHVAKIGPAEGNFIVMGNIYNPLVRDYVTAQGIEIGADNPGREGYILQSDRNSVVVAGWDDQGAFHGLQSLRQLISKKDRETYIPLAKVRDWPHMAFRGIRAYAPSKDAVPFFKRFLRDHVALYKYNKIVLGVTEVMVSDRHPELRAGWHELIKELNYSRRYRSEGPNRETQTGLPAYFGTIPGLDRKDLAELMEYGRQLNIEVIPEIRTLVHTYYYLTRHRDLAEIRNAEWPDNWCPSNPKSTELWFSLMDEFLDEIKPEMIHIGRDEWRMPMHVCELCKGKDYRVLFAQDLQKIYDYLRGRNIKVAMWGDHLLESVRGVGHRDRVSPTGYKYKIPAALSEEQVAALIPKDILVFNWSWRSAGGEENDIKLQEMGFNQVFGNFSASIPDWERRSSRSGVLGGAPSIWSEMREFDIGKDVIHELLGAANILWSTHWPDADSLLAITRSRMPQVRENLKGRALPSDDDNRTVPVDISRWFNLPSGGDVMGFHPGESRAGTVQAGNKVFELGDPRIHGGKTAVVVGTEGREKNPLPREVRGIEIGRDVSSLIFLHAAARPSANNRVYHADYNVDDTADMLGWYEIVYEDGFMETVPIRYGLNILEYNLSSGNYCYEGDAVDCAKPGSGSPMTYFAYEWVNTRFGQAIKEVNLKGTSGFRGTRGFGLGNVIPGNAVVLKAISVVEKRAQHQRVGEVETDREF